MVLAVTSHLDLSAVPGRKYFVLWRRPYGATGVYVRGGPMQAEVKGTTMPILEVALERGEQVISTHGELAWMTASIQMSQTASSGGGARGLVQGLKRVAGGGGLFITRYSSPVTKGQAP